MINDPQHITAWQRLTDSITTSGRLKRRNIAELAALGVRHVINLAPDSSIGALRSEAKLLEQHGIQYTHIPIPFGDPQEEHFQQFVAALRDTSQPVHVHCIANWRVSACFYRYHCQVLGMQESAARTLMEQQWCPETNLYPGAKAWAKFIKMASQMQ